MRDNATEIEKFLTLKEANGQSNYTIVSQRSALTKLNTFLNGKPFRETSEDDIISFISAMNKTLASSTTNMIKIVVKSFYRQLYHMKRHEYPPQVQNIQGNGTHKKRLPIRPEDILTKEDIANLVRLCDNFRNKAIVTVLYESAARIGEMMAINLEHLHFDSQGAVLVIEGKTGSRRIRLIEAVPFLQRWIESHPHNNKKHAPLWCALTRDYQRLKPCAVREILAKLKRRSRIQKRLNPHAFRHSRITELAKFLSDAKLKVFSGWSANSTMSSVYVHLSGKDLDSDLLKIAGIEPTKNKLGQSPLKTIQCSRCNALNDGIAEFCHFCGRPLNEVIAIEDTLENPTLKAQVTELTEKLEDAGEVVDSMWDVIDKLKEEIKRLKPRITRT